MKRLKYACYMTNITMSVVSMLSPLLFLTFREQYGVSYSLLGLLVLVNFVTQLGIDLIFSFFSHKFNIPLTVKLTPLIAAGGFLLYGLAPFLFPGAPYIGVLAGTVIVSLSSGLAEVLISPVIAALPAEDPDREMSKLHSVFAWGEVGVIAVSTLYLQCFGGENWMWLALLLAMIPFASFLLFAGATVPPLQTPECTAGALRQFKNKTLWLSVAGIFLGGAAECTMAQWCSGYLERAAGIPKLWGDLGGAAMFAVMLGLGRTLYANHGKNISRVLLLGSIGAVACYLVCALSPWPLVGLIACGLTGLCTSMLWPGSLVVAEKRFPAGGVFIFAIMAAGGDLGASIGPQLVGLVTDAAAASSGFSRVAAALSLTGEQLGLKIGMLVAAVFPLLAVVIFRAIHRGEKKERRDEAV